MCSQPIVKTYITRNYKTMHFCRATYEPRIHAIVNLLIQFCVIAHEIRVFIAFNLDHTTCDNLGKHVTVIDGDVCMCVCVQTNAGWLQFHTRHSLVIWNEKKKHILALLYS